MSKETYVNGKLIEQIDGDYNIFSNTSIEYNAQLYEAQGMENGLSYNKPENVNLGNSFIPVVTIVSNGKGEYEFKDKEGSWRLDMRIDSDKRFPRMQRVRLISAKPIVKLKFEVRKGSKTANDDSGIITAAVFNTSQIRMYSKKIKTKYDNTIEIDIKSFEVGLIKFYADDDDLIFDGGVSHIFCGGIRIGDCQAELIEKNVKSIVSLSAEERAKFIATVLVESAHGKEPLWDIAYIYLNLVINEGLENGLRKSSAYNGKIFTYKAHLYHLGFGKQYAGLICTEDNSMKGRAIEYQAKKFKSFKQVQEFIEFCKSKIFVNSPVSKYKDWEGQGYYGDMNIRMHDHRKIWAMASQYYHLQKQCKVKDRLIVPLFDNSAINNNKDIYKEGIPDSTTFIYHSKKIIKYFTENPSFLPKYDDGDYLSSKTTLKLAKYSPENAIPPVYILENRKFK